MNLAPTYLIYRTGFAPTNGTSVQMARLFGSAEDAVVHLLWDAREAGAESVPWRVNTDDAPAWARHREGAARVWRRARRLVGLAWWNGERLNGAKLARALAHIPVRPRQAWVVCYGEWDAIRALALWEAVGRPPFVLHVLDILEPELSEAKTPRFLRLIRSAGQVVCLNGLIEDEMRRAGARATELFPLCSDTAPTRRDFPAAPLKIMVSGALYVNPRGPSEALRLLIESWPGISRAFPGAELHYAGTSSAALPAELRPSIRDHGLLDPRKAYPALSRSCHVAYVPVSHADTVYRFSLPSRIPDYLACGLPVLACTRTGSGIDDFFRTAPRACTRVVQDTDEFLAALQDFAGDAARWERASRAALAFAEESFSMAAARARTLHALSAAAAGAAREAGHPVET